jgi:phosphate transport system permease protein
VTARLRYRKLVSGFMLAMTGLAAFITVAVLFFILGYLVYHGGTSINWNFFTKLPTPVGENGGGMANAIVGSAKLLFLASLIGVPIGFLGGVYLAEFSGGGVAFIVRYAADLLNGVPSIVIGIFAYALVVLPFKHYSTLAGSFALALMMIPITLRSTEQFLQAVPGSLREGAWRWAPANRERLLPWLFPRRTAAFSPRFCWRSPALPAKPLRCCSPRSAIASGVPAGNSRRLRFP